MAYSDLWARRLRERQAKLGKTNPDVVTATGLQTRTYNNYHNGRREPDFVTLLKICEALRATPNYFLLESESEPLSAAENRLVEIYRSLTDEQRATFERVVSSFRTEVPPLVSRPLVEPRLEGILSPVADIKKRIA